MIQIALGSEALVRFRQQRLLAKVQQQNALITQLKAHYVYFISGAAATTVVRDKMVHLLGEITWIEEHHPYYQQSSILVVPRLGTISPWSSKATDIARVCGVTELERLERGIWYQLTPEVSATELAAIAPLLYDRMTESALFSLAAAPQLFQSLPLKPLQFIPVLEEGITALQTANSTLGLALSTAEINYLAEYVQQVQRNPTDVELMMFAQVNSEHCRHKIFNGQFIIDGVLQPHSLFKMIKNTYHCHSAGILSAYKDNAAIVEGFISPQFESAVDSYDYRYEERAAPLVIKVETHNHPTAISPFAGAATGAGGEIRDEAAAGQGAKTKAGLAGFSVSHLRLPDLPQPWEMPAAKPDHLATPLEIMLEGPIGAASFNNEFGRPNLCGYFRTFEMTLTENSAFRRGYHKPIMIAGGMGTIRPEHCEKATLPVAAKLIVLGGPAMRIGLGGGAASSMSAGTSQQELDFASVQRSNPEMQRRAQEVINRCFSYGKRNPILSVHDVGAGGLSNALPELVYGSERGGLFDLNAIPNAEPDLSPLEIWCNEAQERYVLAIAAENLPVFTAIAARERCPFAVIGEATVLPQLVLQDKQRQEIPIDMPLSVLLGKAPPLIREVARQLAPQGSAIPAFAWQEAVKRVLQFPCVASKSFLITIGDRTVTGLVARDQMVGPWQVPVADVAVTASSYQAYVGEAMAMGERTPLALLDAAAAARMAVGEAITNIAAAAIENIQKIALSANWMAAAGFQDEDARLYDAVQAVGMEFCPALGICIPVGKDSLSMRTVWQQDNSAHTVAAPLSLIISAFAPVTDIRKTLTPQLVTDAGDTELLLIDLGAGKNRLGGSVLAQVYNTLGQETPDITPTVLKNFFAAIQALNQQGLLLAYHDRSDGGLLAVLCEMAFAGHTGVTVTLDQLGTDPRASLFAEELGAVIQVRTADKAAVLALLNEFTLDKQTHKLGKLNTTDEIVIEYQQTQLLTEKRSVMQQWWSETSYRIQALRDNPQCAADEFATLKRDQDPGLRVHLTFPVPEAPTILRHTRPQVAILREQGVNGHQEMAAAFDRAGFQSVDVHMTDILSGAVSLKNFQGLAACGGFSYGDVLGAGSGWAQSILLHPRARDEFATFFARSDTFSLGVCNGCQMMAQLQELIPGSELWPRFKRNVSEQFEARLVMVEIVPSPSVFFQGMVGSKLPIVVAHGEGYADFATSHQLQEIQQQQLVALRYIDPADQATEHYPFNPNGSPQGITAVTSRDGRATILMPHPERMFRTPQWSWHPRQWAENSPWLQMFLNARQLFN